MHVPNAKTIIKYVKRFSRKRLNYKQQENNGRTSDKWTTNLKKLVIDWLNLHENLWVDLHRKRSLCYISTDINGTVAYASILDNSGVMNSMTDFVEQDLNLRNGTFMLCMTENQTSHGTNIGFISLDKRNLIIIFIGLQKIHRNPRSDITSHYAWCVVCYECN